MKPAQAAALREVFPPEAIGKLPKGGAQLDYVGHAAVTQRLLDVDPEWTWEPVAFDATGLPAYDAKGGLWIRLTVGGTTRLGYGDGPDPKQRIGDAIRNAAMRFGVALDLWSKDEIGAVTPETDELPVRAKTARRKTPPAPPRAPSFPAVVAAVEQSDAFGGEPPASPKQRGMYRALLAEKHPGISRDALLALVVGIVGREVASSNELTMSEMGRVLDALGAA